MVERSVVWVLTLAVVAWLTMPFVIGQPPATQPQTKVALAVKQIVSIVPRAERQIEVSMSNGDIWLINQSSGEFQYAIAPGWSERELHYYHFIEVEAVRGNRQGK